MKKILVLSDTHSYIDERIISFASESDYIIHAGDIGKYDIIEKLKLCSYTHFVYGNIDNNEIRSSCNDYESFSIDGLKILLTHISGKSPKYNNKTLKKIKQFMPDILISGHSHILKVEFDKKNNLLFINPGAAGRHGFHKKRTMIRFEINKSKIQNMEIIELGLRSKLPDSVN